MGSEITTINDQIQRGKATISCAANIAAVRSNVIQNEMSKKNRGVNINKHPKINHNTYPTTPNVPISISFNDFINNASFLQFNYLLLTCYIVIFNPVYQL